ncbi:hypothetical protein C8A05DRAFT_18392 [Staphylotrichum tortipilum]|uniref:Uncharacterized protein n=1 Tax=Staphylotrichum tortipilum TaxID=2831512 RepID=A0AAN6ME60_9PEZI|nr:hypothetical protein C8A05DRAFT_18392 [Staphylotrichum longicolle]
MAAPYPYATWSTTPPKHRNPSSKQNTAHDTNTNSTQPWTATRCHRLLRPLLAHIAALRKAKEHEALLKNGQALAALSNAPKTRKSVLGKRSYPYFDPDYSDTKKPCRKYSRKASRRRPSADQSCTPQRNVHLQRLQQGDKAAQGVVLPTPFLRRVRNHQPSSPCQAPDDSSREDHTPASRCCHSGAACRAKTKCGFDMELAALRPTMDAEKHGLYESVFKAFDAILRVTSSQQRQGTGPKSLLAMCLRKVPAYIAGVEEWERREAEENGTKVAVQGAGVSFDIYSELESMGAVDGWRHLCLLVRAHAVHIIEDATSEGLFDDSVTGLLIRLCLEYMPHVDFTSLLETFVVRQYPRPQSAEDHLFTSPDLLPLRVLRSCDPSGTSVMPRMLANLLADGLLPADWLLNKSFISLWPSTIRSVTQMKPCQDTVDFITTTLELLCDLASPKKPRGVPQTRLRGKPQTTLISTIAALGSVVLLSEEGSSQSTETASATRAATLRRRIEHVVATCSANLSLWKRGGRKLGTYLLALCAFVSLQETDAASALAIEAAWRGVQNCRGNAHLMLQYDATTALMSAVGHSCSRGTGLAPHIYLSRFCDKLETLALPAGALSNMRVDGAFRLAELTGDLRDLTFAEGLQVKAQADAAAACATPERTRGSQGSTRSNNKNDTKKNPPSFSGIRWDDGISEWVAVTPATDLRPGRIPHLRSHGHCPTNGDSPSSDSDDATTSQDELASDPEIDSDTEPVETPPTTAETTPAPSPHSSETDAEKGTSDIEFFDTATRPPSPARPLPASPPTEPASGSPSPPSPSPSPSPPPPAGGFLAARPRRLSRPAGAQVAGEDELGMDEDEGMDEGMGYSTGGEGRGRGKGNVRGGGNWLGRKGPARFRPLGSSASTTKRVARASLVYLKRSRPAGVAKRRSWGGESYGEGGESEDELSFL